MHDRLLDVLEDLGVVTPEAMALRAGCGFPGMRILQFAFGSDRVRLARNERLYFVRVEPNEMAVLADVDVDFLSIG